MRSLHLLIISFFLYSSPLFCNYNIELLSHISYSGGEDGSSCWHYNAPNGKEYAIMGTTKGTRIYDITTPESPALVNFYKSQAINYWREMKVYGDYAYIVQDNSTQYEGLLIADLSNIEDTIIYYDYKGHDGRLRKGHTVWIDENGYMYINGGTYNSVAIYDLKDNPTIPKYISTLPGEYVHDCYVRGDSLYAANIYDGHITIWNIEDKGAPFKINSFKTPKSNSHNCWLSDDGNTLFATDETTASAISVFDIHDYTDIKLIQQFKIRQNAASIVHNVHILDDFIIASYYTEGVIIADASDPTDIVLTGVYDTYTPSNGGTYNGCWEADPYTTSGNIVASDIDNGMFILKPEYIRAARFRGTVRNKFSLDTIVNAKLEALEISLVKYTDLYGVYKISRIDTGDINFIVSAPGYISDTVIVHFANGDIIYKDIFLEPINTANFDRDLLRDFLIYSSNNQIHIQTSLPQSYTSVIFNTSGQKIWEDNSIGNRDIDLYYIPKGLYYIQISTAEGRIFTKALPIY